MLNDQVAKEKGEPFAQKSFYAKQRKHLKYLMKIFNNCSNFVDIIALSLTIELCTEQETFLLNASSEKWLALQRHDE